MAVASPPASTKRRTISFGELKEHLTGYLFVLPAVLLVSLFGLFPIGYAFYMSLRRWRVMDRGFIGLDNYAKAIGDWYGALMFGMGFVVIVAAYFVWDRGFNARGNRGMIARLVVALILIAGGALIATGWGRMLDAVGRNDDFLRSLPITLYYAVGAVPIQLGIALVLAYILFQKIRGQEFFRMVFFLPYVTPVIATALVFRSIFSPRETSLANQLLTNPIAQALGLEPQKWLFESERLLNVIFGTTFDGFLAGPSMALWSITLFGIWTYVGYNTVIFLAGLGNIPVSVYEAAEIDGANQWQLFRYITVPLLSPVTFYLSLIGFIGTFKAFNHIFIMQEPSAQGTVETASVAIFNTFYKANQFGFATAPSDSALWHYPLSDVGSEQGLWGQSLLWLTPRSH